MKKIKANLKWYLQQTEDTSIQFLLFSKTVKNISVGSSNRYCDPFI